MNYRQVKAIQAKNEKRILECCPRCPHTSGIYILRRIDEEGIKYAYVGQAKDLLSRLAQHLSGYQHIDLSLKKHGLSSADNPFGWSISFCEFDVSELDAYEKKFIKDMAQRGFQLRNKTAGGQGEGKVQIDEYRPSKGYRDGLKQGYLNAQKEISKLFDKYLDAVPKNEKKTTKLQLKALEKFEDFINYEVKDNENQV